MKGECPNCGIAYQTDDFKIPDKGAYARCPKCRTRIFLTKEIESRIIKADPHPKDKDRSILKQERSFYKQYLVIVFAVAVFLAWWTGLFTLGINLFLSSKSYNPQDF